MYTRSQDGIRCMIRPYAERHQLQTIFDRAYYHWNYHHYHAGTSSYRAAALILYEWIQPQCQYNALYAYRASTRHIQRDSLRSRAPYYSILYTNLIQLLIYGRIRSRDEWNHVSRWLHSHESIQSHDGATV